MIKFHKLLSLAILLFLALSCSSEKNKNFVLQGHIKGLKKGTVYLQKTGDSSLITLDSLVILGNPKFELQADINEPLLLYLRLYKSENDTLFIPFFADKGITTIETTLKNFNYDAIVKGSKQQELLENYKKVVKRYQEEKLKLIEARFEAFKAKDTVAEDSILKRSNQITKLTYAHAINFAFNNKDNEIAPYVALYEIPNANPKYLDSIYNSLEVHVKQSFYGKKLNNYLATLNLEN